MRYVQRLKLSRFAYLVCLIALILELALVHQILVVSKFNSLLWAKSVHGLRRTYARRTCPWLRGWNDLFVMLLSITYRHVLLITFVLSCIRHPQKTANPLTRES